jgi:Tfp pilus assembly protein PilO
MIEGYVLKIKNRKQVVMIAPVVAGLFLGMLLVVQPSMTRLAYLKAEKGGLSQKENTFNNIVMLEKKLSDYRQRLSRILDKAKFVEELNAIAGQSQLTVLSVVPEEEKTTAVYLKEIDVRIDAEGNYHQVGDFVSRVESLKQFAKITSVEINADAGAFTVDTLGTAAAPRGRSPRINAYKIALVVGLFYPAKDVF